MKTAFLFSNSVALVVAAVFGFGAAQSIRADVPTDGVTNGLKAITTRECIKRALAEGTTLEKNQIVFKEDN